LQGFFSDLTVLERIPDYTLNKVCWAFHDSVAKSVIVSTLEPSDMTATYTLFQDDVPLMTTPACSGTGGEFLHNLHVPVGFPHLELIYYGSNESESELFFSTRSSWCPKKECTGNTMPLVALITPGIHMIEVVDLLFKVRPAHRRA
jgi:hypothetical protein